MADPDEPRVIKGSNYVANILVSAEVPSVFIWDVPGVQPFAALRTELLVIKTDVQGGAGKVYLLAIERLSHKHRFIDLWENPLCRGINPIALTSKGRDQGPERMRILFSTAEMAQAFFSQVEDVLLSHTANRRHQEWVCARPVHPPSVAAVTDAAQLPCQASFALSRPTDDDSGALSPGEKHPAYPPSVDAATDTVQSRSATCALELLHNESPAVACCSTSSGGCPNEHAILAIKDQLRGIATKIGDFMDHVDPRYVQMAVPLLGDAVVSHAETAATPTEKVSQDRRTMQDTAPPFLHAAQLALSSLRSIVKMHDPSGGSQHNLPVRGDGSPRELPAQRTQHLKRRDPEVPSPLVSKRPRTGQRAGRTTAITLFMLCAGGNDLTTVRFGTVEWVADAHQLRAQVYIVGRAAWDSASALYATLRSVYRDEAEPGYACLVFPTRGLATMFVEAWASHRLHSEDWAHVQACIV